MNTLKGLRFPLIYFSSPFKFKDTLGFYDDIYDDLRDVEMTSSYNIYDKDLFFTNHSNLKNQ